MGSFYNEWMSRFYLAKGQNRTPRNRQKIRVVFVVQNTDVWDKQRTVYEAFVMREDTEAFLVLCPTYETPDYLAHKPYGWYDKNIWKFFHDTYDNVYDMTNIMDIRALQPDYVFFEHPYNHLRLLESANSNEIVKFSRICYIPYGCSGAEVFLQLAANNRDFFQNVSFVFCSSNDEKEWLKEIYVNSRQHFEFLGYPAFEHYMETKSEDDGMIHVLWTPRWSYDPIIGGSHFFEYKDVFLDAVDSYRNNNNVSFSIRPHPLMFDTFVNEKRMSLQEVEEFKDKLREKNIDLEIGTISVTDSLDKADILITDYSSIISMYFLFGRPIIYCPFEPKVLPHFKEMMGGMYIVKRKEDIKYYLDNLIDGIDPLKDLRRYYVKKSHEMHKGACERIVERIVSDFHREGRNFVIPDLEAEEWILKQKVMMIKVLLNMPLSSLTRICDQIWYEEYIGLLGLEMISESVRIQEQEYYNQLLKWYYLHIRDNKKNLATLAMLLFVNPIQLPVPLEIDLWPEQLQNDVWYVFKTTSNFQIQPKTRKKICRELK